MSEEQAQTTERLLDRLVKAVRAYQVKNGLCEPRHHPEVVELLDAVTACEERIEGSS